MERPPEQQPLLQVPIDRFRPAMLSASGDEPVAQAAAVSARTVPDIEVAALEEANLHKRGTSPFTAVAPLSSSDGIGGIGVGSSAPARAAPAPAAPPGFYGQGAVVEHSRDQMSSSAAMCKGCARLNGNVITLWTCGRPVGLWPMTCQWGPDWPCNLCTFTLILAPSLPFLALVAPQLHWGAVLGGVVLALAALILLALTALSDPGYIPKQTPEEMEDQRRHMEETGQAGTYTVCREFRFSLRAGVLS